MPSVTSIRVEGLRSLRDTDFIDLKPITILVGRNSSGKSSFARVFPLLRQSTEENKRAPVLWYGRYVDFGSILEAQNDRTRQPITFGFKVTIPGSRRVTLNERGETELYENPEPIDVEAFLTVRSRDGNDVTSVACLRLNLLDTECKIEFDEKNEVSDIRVGTFSWRPSEGLTQRISNRHLIPTFGFIRNVERPGSPSTIVPVQVAPLRLGLRAELRRYLHGNTTFRTIDRIAEQLPVATSEQILDRLPQITNAPAQWYMNTVGWTRGDLRITRLRDRVIAASLPGLLSQINDRLDAFFAGVRYIEPLRATAQRYYRRQELAIDEIDSKGANVPFFLEGLAPHERARFDAWLASYFGFTIYAESAAGHISLKLKAVDDDVPRNLADLGFGFSQLLPVALQLWALTRAAARTPGRRYVATSVVVIEQPELHLHPAYQARLADVLAACFDPDGVGPTAPSDVAMVIETHSSSLINRLGVLVSEGRIRAGDIQIVLFEKETERADTAVRLAHFDDTGVLQDWPFGFLEG